MLCMAQLGLHSGIQWAPRGYRKQVFQYQEGEVPLGSQERMWLACLNDSMAGRVLKPATQGQAGTVTDPFDKEGHLAKEPYQWEHSGEENLWLSNSRLSQFSMDVKNTYYWALIQALYHNNIAHI